MLSGAILGNVFASPSVSSILAAIRAAAGPKGVLLIVKNYTGDRLNFGMALEKAKSEGIAVKMVIVDDDVALPPGKGITGGRGIAGTIFVHKVAGAIAARGGSLEEVYETACRAIESMGTLGLALSTCTIPGSTASNDRLHAPGSCEIGMGIHGEPGRELITLPTINTANITATTLVDSILQRISISNSTPVAILVNNLGALSVMEMLLMTKAIVDTLRTQNIQISRIYSGIFMTSLDMSGLSLTILKLNNDILSLLDDETTASAWQKSSPTDVNISSRTINAVQVDDNVTNTNTISTYYSISTALVQHYGSKICNIIIQAEPELTSYDTICGDGDCGLVMKKGAENVLNKINSITPSIIPVVELCNTIADALSEVMGGTSGALLEIFFRAMASSFASKVSSVNEDTN
jgi:triose/dihydroxyacetone kinase / FAD-AMP lyase (cyclizing)